MHRGDRVDESFNYSLTYLHPAGLYLEKRGLYLRMYDIFWIGCNVQYARLCQRLNPPVRGENFLLDALEGMKRRLEEFEINSGMQGEVSEWIQKLRKSYGDKAKLRPMDASQLSEDADRWRDLLNRELIGRVIFEFLRSGALNQEALLATSEGKPSAFFEEVIWNALSDIEKNDFSNSAKCLLVGLPTPSVMVALRGAKATMKKYYEHKTGESAKEKVWGSIIRELKQRSEELKIRDTFLGYLDYIRDAKRNFAEHPNKIYDQREAEFIFMEAVNLVKDTYADMV